MPGTIDIFLKIEVLKIDWRYLSLAMLDGILKGYFSTVYISSILAA